MLRLLVGPYRSGKTGQLLRELVAFKNKHPFDRCIILVPSQRYGALVRAQLAEIVKTSSDSAGLFDVDIATIYDACADVLRLAGVHQTVLQKDLAGSVVSMAVSELQKRDQLPNLAPISHFSGTSRAILRLLDEFERAAVSPAHVQAATANTAAADSKYRELASIYKEYWSQLDALNCLDQKRMAFSCREILSRKDLKHFRLGLLLVDGFDRISPLQAEVIQALSQRATQTHIAFDYVEPHIRDHSKVDDYAWKDTSFQELTKRFQVKPEYSTVPENAKIPTEFAFKALDTQFEMAEIVRRCKEAMIHRGVQPSQILVVARDIAEYELSAKAAFEDARIPYAIDHSIAYIDLPLFKLMLKMATLARGEFARRELCECLRSNFVDLAAIGLTHQQVESLDSKSLDKGVVGGRERWEAFLLRYMPEQVYDAVTKLLDILTPAAQATVGEYCRWFEGIENLLIRQTQATLATSAPEEIESLQGLRTIVRTLIQQESVFGSKQVEYAEFLRLLFESAENASFRRSLSHPHAVTICSAEHAPNRRYDEVFIAGVTEGRFPKHSGESGFVSADERARWAGFGITLTNPREEAGFERALFRSLIERARKRVCFSLPDFTNGGDEAIPSFFLTDGTASPQKIEHIRPAAEALKHPVSAREAVGGWLWTQPGIELNTALSRHPAAEEFWQTINVSVLAAYQRHQKNNSNVYNGYLVDLTESHWLDIKLPNAWSASALNNYGQCPFKYWVTNLLKIEPPREPQLGIAVDIKGDLYHRALEIYYSKLVQLDPEQQETTKDDILKAALTQAVSDLSDDPRFSPGPYWENEQKDMLFRLRRFIDFDDKRLERQPAKPAMFEAKFGTEHYEESYPALRLDTQAGQVVIRGRIDRIDISESVDGQPPCATVIDYKTGSNPISQADAQVGTNLQLPLYALAVSKSIMPGARVSNGHYLSINAAKSIGSIDFAAEKSAGLLEHTTLLVGHAVQSVKSGDFGVRPQSSKACKHCSHKPICRVTDLNHANGEES